MCHGCRRRDAQKGTLGCDIIIISGVVLIIVVVCSIEWGQGEEDREGVTTKVNLTNPLQ